MRYKQPGEAGRMKEGMKMKTYSNRAEAIAALQKEGYLITEVYGSITTMKKESIVVCEEGPDKPVHVYAKTVSCVLEKMYQ